MPPQKRLHAFAAAFFGIIFLISFPWRNYIDVSSNQEILGSRRLLESKKCKENQRKSMKIDSGIIEMLSREAPWGGATASR